MTTPDEYFERRFAELEQEWLAGPKQRGLPALFDVVREAHVAGRPLPEWAALAVLNLVIDRFNSTRGQKGKSKYVVDYVHWKRWQTLSFQFAKRGIKYVKRDGRPKKPGIKEAREAASDLLSKDVARGLPRQMQDSFDLVEKVRATDDARFTFARN